MMNTRIEQAVILAAGFGSRIRGQAELPPKPLISVGGLPLLKRAILTAKKAGVRRFVVVLGFQGERVRDALRGDADLDGLEIIWADNPRYALANGVSVLTARPHIEGEFFLTMADHVVDAAIYEGLQAQPANEGLILAVDRKLETIFDMDDATKVKTGRGERIDQIGKQLTDFDAVDTGVFRCSSHLFDALEVTLAERGDVSLSDGVQALAARGVARVWDIGAAWWQDVDEEATKKHAEKLLFKSLTKPIDGPISRNVNRRFSKVVTRLVMNYDVVPNHMTTVGLIVGLLAAFITALTTTQNLWLFAVGGFLYQLSSMLDGCDGEIARLKFKHSDWGEWYDTVSDDIINLSYQLSVGYALFRISGERVWLHLSVATVAISLVLCFFLYRRLMSMGRGTHLALEWTAKEADDVSLVQRIIAKLEFVAHRDFYALFLMVLAFIGAPALKMALIMSLVVMITTAAQWAIMNVREATTRRAARHA